MMYPDPCVECAGVERHELGCPALRRGAGTLRNVCGSRYPRNRSWVCEKPLDHDDPFCEGNLDLWGRRVWLFDQSERHPSVEA